MKCCAMMNVTHPAPHSTPTILYTRWHPALHPPPPPPPAPLLTTGCSPYCTSPPSRQSHPPTLPRRLQPVLHLPPSPCPHPYIGPPPPRPPSSHLAAARTALCTRPPSQSAGPPVRPAPSRGPWRSTRGQWTSTQTASSHQTAPGPTGGRGGGRGFRQRLPVVKMLSGAWRGGGQGQELTAQRASGLQSTGFQGFRWGGRVSGF